MIEISIAEATNGYYVQIHNWKTNSHHKEIAERYVDALSIIYGFLDDENTEALKAIRGAL